jgi:hypothetical protein
MAGLAYLGKDKRPYIKASLYSPKGLVDSVKEFLLDSGSTESAIDQECVKGQGFTLEGIFAVDTPAGSKEFASVSGAVIEFDVTNKDGNSSTVKCDLPLLILSRSVIGIDQISHLGLTFAVDLQNNSTLLVEG